jgi:hypothetical protein
MRHEFTIQGLQDPVIECALHSQVEQTLPGFDYGMSTAIQQGVSTCQTTLLNDNSTWRSYGISPRFFFSEKQKKQKEKFLQFLHCE